MATESSFLLSSIFFCAIVVGAIVILWQLRRRGKFYCVISDVSLVVGVAVLVLFIYSVVSLLLHSPQPLNPPTGPYPVVSPQIFNLLF